MIWLISRTYLLLMVSMSSANGELYLEALQTNPEIGSAFLQDNPCKDLNNIPTIVLPHPVPPAEGAKDQWVPFQDEKCLRAFQNKIDTYDKARAFCKEKYGGNLVTVDFKDKQLFFFLENYLKTKNIANDIWIRLKHKINSTYEWADGGVYAYSNWASGSPKNDPKLCVQMLSHQPNFGRWSDIPCTKKNLVICEINQPWSGNYLQKMVINMRRHAIPIGFIYVQLPKEKSPKDIWPGFRWIDVSSDYADVFFRVEGKKSASFGAVQQPDSPRITNIQWGLDNKYAFPSAISLTADNKYSPYVITGFEDSDLIWFNSHGLRFLTSNAEVRPLNMAIRVWKRIP